LPSCGRRRVSDHNTPRQSATTEHRQRLWFSPTGKPAFGIGESLIAYSRPYTYARAFLVGPADSCYITPQYVPETVLAGSVRSHRRQQRG